MKILVTGCTGSLASVLIPLLLEDGHEVVGVSRDEYKQSLVPKHEKLTLYLCDVRDRDRLLEASRGVDLAFHAAAMKRIEACEAQPEEAIGINVLGTQNLLFCQRMNKIARVVLVGTDKACRPTTLYGYTKAAAEGLVLRNINNQVVRYGNICGSRGSVAATFAESIKKDGTIYVTDKRSTRFWWTLPEAADFVYRSALREPGGLCIPSIKAAPVVSLGQAIAKLLSMEPPTIKEIGFRCREKLHEDLRTEDEGGALVSSDQQLWFTKRELEETLQDALRGIL